MSRPLLLLLGLLLLIFLTFFCYSCNRAGIEERLAGDVTAAVTALPVAQELTDLSVTTEGLHVFLDGTAPSEEAKAATGAAAAAFYGAAGVTNRLILDGSAVLDAPPVDAPPVEGAPSLDVAMRSNLVRLSGVVPNADVQTALVDGAAQAVGAGNVVDELTIDGNVTGADWLPSLAGVFPFLAENASQPGIGIENGVLRLTGTVETPEMREQIEQRVRDAVGAAVQIDNQITVSAAQAELDEVLAVENVEFVSARDVITAETRDVIDRIVAVLTQYPDVNIRIEGHTDSDGRAESNLSLSQRRADAVRQALIDAGIDGNRLTAEGFGESRLLVQERTAADKQRNRRVELKVVD